MGPHEPWDTPRPWAGLHINFNYRNGTTARLDSSNQKYPMPKATAPVENTPSNQEIAAVRADYADHLALLDDQLGLLLEHLAEPSMITVVSDHGELLGDGIFLQELLP